jgi:hypothetical protein
VASPRRARRIIKASLRLAFFLRFLSSEPLPSFQTRPSSCHPTTQRTVLRARLDSIRRCTVGCLKATFFRVLWKAAVFFGTRPPQPVQTSTMRRSRWRGHTSQHTNQHQISKYLGLGDRLRLLLRERLPTRYSPNTRQHVLMCVLRHV